MRPRSPIAAVVPAGSSTVTTRSGSDTGTIAALVYGSGTILA